MTVNIAYSATSDGHLTSGSPTYSTARNGGPNWVTDPVGAAIYYGQNNNGGSYTILEGFLAFTYAAIPATELVTACYLRTWSVLQLSTAVARDLEIRGMTWSAGGLTTADWKNPTQLAAGRLDAVVKNVQTSQGKFTLAGSDNMVSNQSSVTARDFVLSSSRQRAGNTPTADEGSAISSAEETAGGGTGFDPALVWLTVTRSTLVPVLTASVRTSGGHAHLFSDGAAGSYVYLRHWDDAGNSWTATLPSGTIAGTFDVNTRGAQGFSLVVDEADNLYVVGKAGDATNSLAVRAYVKSVGAWSWTAGTLRTAALPTYDASLNNVSAAYHTTAGGTLVVCTGHTAGQGVTGGTGNELSYVLLDAAYLRTGTGTLIRSSGSMLGTLQPAAAPSAFNGFGNPTGTGLDVVADLVQPDWGYVVSFRKDQDVGQNLTQHVGRYILNASGNAFTHTSTQSTSNYAVKDAGAKMRLVPCGDGQVAVITTDSDVGWGLTIRIYQAQGTTPGLVQLGGYSLAGDAPNIPDGPAVATANWWDAVYSEAENSVWIYYRHASDATKVMRTRFSLSTYQATGQEVQVYSGVNVIGVRAPRNARVSTYSRLQVATYSGGSHALTEVVDQFNLAPTAPVLNPRANYDASAAATFSWTFTDPNAGDTQSAYDLEIQRTDTNATVVATGKTSSTVSTRNVTGGTLTNGLSYRWRVRTWDAADTVGPFSDWGTFSTSAGGAVTITDPALDNPANVVTDEIQVSWNVAGTTQDSYRVILKRNDTGGTVSDSGWIVSTATTYLVTGMVTGVEHTIQVQVRNASLVTSGIGSRLVTPNYGTPEVPVVTVTPIPAEGYVLVSVDNPISGQPDLGTTVKDQEGGTTAGWTPFSATVESSTEQAHSGTRSLKLVSTGTPVQAYARYGSLDMDGPPVLVPTERYTARMWIYVPVTRLVGVGIDWFGPGWSYITTNAFTLTVTGGTWTEMSVTGTCPEGADRCTFGPTLGDNPTAGSVLYVDDVILVAASDRPAVSRNLILRREAGSTDPWEVLGETDPDGSFRDYTAPGRVPVEYVVRGVAD